MSIDRDQVNGHRAASPFGLVLIGALATTNFVPAAAGFTEVFITGLLNGPAAASTVIVTIGSSVYSVFYTLAYALVLKLYPTQLFTIAVTNQSLTACYVNVTLLRNNPVSQIQVI